MLLRLLLGLLLLLLQLLAALRLLYRWAVAGNYF